MYVITGATGNTGKPIAMALLEAGKKVRVICRDAAKAEELSAKGAELFTGDSGDVEFLSKAFEGATAVYAMLPPNMQSDDFTAYQMKMADALAAAIERTGVKYVISLSSVGAHLAENTGVIKGLHYMEKKFNSIPGLNTLHLRPTYFIENTIGQAAMAKHMGMTGSPVRADIPLPVIATKDIAAYGAKRLLALDFSGNNVQYLLGSRDVTYNEVAHIIGNAIGMPDLKYVEVPFADFKHVMTTQWGASENVADMFAEFITAMNAGLILGDAKRNAESTTPTAIEEFAQVYAHVFATA
jgi:uncharacterized protein YbjT (DUF2867 family)